ncbi:MAG: phosphatase PAP2 family protein [Bacteroidetes bacterium]|nr:phosphatase PAP2 family protein [Bacteroidota bacterium]
MKTQTKLNKIFLFVSLLAIGFAACKRDLKERTANIEALNPINADTNAGNWKPILLSKPDEFAMDAPIAVSSPDYKLELLEIKSRQNQITDAERDAMEYWASGSVMRWNEILRELVAKYNLPPYQNADGTYPIPSAANPFAYPNFPFSNPPYAARAYAYVSAAQYDALVAAYHYKNVYKRPKPAETDKTIQELIPIAKGYCYPSEDAVAAGSAAAMLTLLFPGEQEFIQQKLAECKNARILAGANSRSDMDAGEKLGRAVAGKFIARARTDKAGSAVGNATDWAKFESDAIAKGETPWISQESPKRPPMLPLFGKVKGFFMDSAEVASQRPAAPPSTNSDQFKTETEEVYKYSKEYNRTNLAIVHRWADGVSTYTPPGHWNAIACEDFIGQHWSEVRWARNLALLNMAMFQAAICCWDAKFAYYNPRPSQVNPKIKTWTGLPNFPSYVSGHSTFSGSAARFLGHILPSKAGDYDAMADEASNSRLYGAIHFRSDIEVGLTMGKAIGDKAIALAIIDGAE